MTCEEFLELAAAYSLGILDDAERESCAAHLARTEHRGCLEAIGEAHEISAKLSITLPVREPSPDVWRGIETQITRSVPLAPGAESRARPWRELAGWFVAAAVVGFHLYSAPVDPQRQASATAAGGARRLGGDSGAQALSLMLAPGTRLSAFAAPQGGSKGGNASIMLNETEKRAVVVARTGTVVQAPEGMNLWTVRGDHAPTRLGTMVAPEGGAPMAAATLGQSLFDPSLPDKLLISVDTPDARAPQAVLQTATFR